tara:strand:+ start:602 stop:1195 length:594 start_codon:yes stop_codon:yes gene_type:complete
MSALLNDRPGDPARGLPDVRGLQIGGAFCGNSAAKFWAGFLAELARDYPNCDEAVFQCTTDRRLQPAMLDPQQGLQEGLDALAGERLEDVVREAEVELEAAGPPGAVQLQLRHAGRTILTNDLPTACMDTVIFPFLLVWILQWAGIPPKRWNDDAVHGAFRGRDPARDAGFALTLELHSAHRAEELYERKLQLRLQS